MNQTHDAVSTAMPFTSPSSPPVVVRLHMWMENDQGVAFGMGRLLLLEAMETHNSLKAAAESLSMSYRAAWGKLKTTEKLLGRELLEKENGNRSGYRLTPFGRDLAKAFRQWFNDVESLALERARELLPFSANHFDG